MNFKDEMNLSVAKLALGDRLKYFDLEDEYDNKLVTFAVNTYLQEITADNFKEKILRKLSNDAYGSDGLLKFLDALSDSERKYLKYGKEEQQIIEANKYDIQTKIK